MISNICITNFMLSYKENVFLEGINKLFIIYTMKCTKCLEGILEFERFPIRRPFCFMASSILGFSAYAL